MVHLMVPHEHRKRAFQDVRSATLYGIGDREPRMVSDFGGVHARDPSGVTLALFADEAS
jgi:hypothetical protein